MPTIGFIGLGIMGKPMAKNLLRSGFELSVNDLDEGAAAELAAAGAERADLRSLGARSESIFLILPNGAIVKEVLFGSAGIADGLKPGAVVVDMSSVTPGDSKECAERLAQKGIAFLDAPVSGGEPKAVSGELAFMVGGGAEALERVRPMLMAMGKSAVLVGPSGSGSTAKLANQIIVNLTIAAVSEAFVFAAKAGADPAKVFEAIRGGLAGSAVLEAKVPMMLRRDFAPGGKISINLKDIKNVLATAHSIDMPVPFSAALLELMQSLKVQGQMDMDHGSIVRYFERLAGVEVGGPTGAA